MCALAPANAEKRVALVVGNGAYRHADRLANPVNDAQGMRDALKRLGFNVVYGEDLDQRGLRRVIGQFANSVADADVAMVYFAGHGATFGDIPYVVPVDAEFASLGEVSYELVPVETLIGELRQAKGVRIAILDACRDNGAERELKRQAARGGEVTRGLAPMKNPSGLIIAYATQYLSTAADGGGGNNSARHSPFTTALLNNIATPGLDVTEMFRKVGRDVAAATEGKQRPEISISMFEQYALAAAAPKQAEVVPKPAETAPPGGSTAGSDAAQVWRDIQNTTSLVAIDDFIRQYGNVPIYGPLARAKREELAKSQVSMVIDATRSPTPLTAAQERGLKPKDSFRECENCPEMVVVPAASFTMGSAEKEEGRWLDEGPQHDVTIAKPFAVGKFHVTVGQYKAFVQETGYRASPKCSTYEAGGIANWKERADRSWRNPGFTQEGFHPVVCVSFDDAKAYIKWLADKTRKPYRLLSEAEFEYSARGQTSPGAYPRFWFGDSEKDLCRYGNFWDQKAGSTNAPCDDGYDRTSPVGHYQPNAFGLYDMAGNAWQWMEDCWHDNYNGAPADGAAWTAGNCSDHVVRGSAWSGSLRAAFRQKLSGPHDSAGFRLARTITP
jgi:formylglycine-generating enzyme required for sulfatase activity